jgi:hypothetical protein
MKFFKYFAFIALTAFFPMSMSTDASAQKVTTTQISTTRVRPVVVRRVFFRRHYDRFWDSYYYDPYFYDPFLKAQRDKFYLQEDIKDKKKDLAKDREKFNRDGNLSIEEQEKLGKDEEKLAKAVAKLNKFNGEY